MTDIQYLVFSGGGAAGCAFAGALAELGKQPSFSFANIKGVAGTSVGAIAALMVSLNFTPEEASTKLANLDLKKLQDGGLMVNQVFRLLTHYGFYKGEALYAFILNLLKEKTGRDDPENITFADLKTLGFKDLYIVATKLYKENGTPTGKQKIFSHEKTPKTAVAAALLASAAAPIYFARVRFKKIEKGKYVFDETGDLYNDGGILNNYPIDIFDSPKYLGLPDQANTKIINPHTLGLALPKTMEITNAKTKPLKTVISDAHPFEYAESLINSLFFQYEKEKLDKQMNHLRTIQIDRLGVNLSDFSLGEKIKQSLIESGKNAVKDHFINLGSLPQQKENMISLPLKQALRFGIWQSSSEVAILPFVKAMALQKK